MNRDDDILVIGAGFAGLAAAWRAAAAGKKVRLIAKGWGTTHWHSGCIDVLGYYPLNGPAVQSPAESIPQLLADNPAHPYGLVGPDAVSTALEALQSLCARAGYPLYGSLEKNWLLPSAVGTPRPTCLAPEMMTAGDLGDRSPMLLAGFEQFGDFFPQVAADNLLQQGFEAEYAVLDLPALRRLRVLNSTILARLMEQPAFRAEVVQALKPRLGRAARVGFPAVLGLQQAMAVRADLEAQLDRPVFEIPILPPSVPGMRLHHILKRAIEKEGSRLFEGMEAIACESQNGRITAVYTESAARRRPHRFGRYILASGGILGGGIDTDFSGRAREVVFDLPVSAPSSRQEWFRQDFMDRQGHPIYRAGLAVNERLQPLDGSGHVVYENVYAAGTTLAHCEVIRERSLEGVALATGYAAGNLVMG